jgi:hypothetical protein
VDCLYCGKRLGFFANRKKPYCSDVHEDHFLEREAAEALNRLKDEFSEQPHTLRPKPVEDYKYPELSELALDDDSDDGDPYEEEVRAVYEPPPATPGVPAPAGYCREQLTPVGLLTLLERPVTRFENQTPGLVSPVQNGRAILSLVAAGIGTVPITDLEPLTLLLAEMEREPKLLGPAETPIPAELSPSIEIRLKPRPPAVAESRILAGPELDWVTPPWREIPPPALAATPPPLIVPARMDRALPLEEVAPELAFCEVAPPLLFPEPEPAPRLRMLDPILEPLTQPADSPGPVSRVLALPTPEPLRFRVVRALQIPDFPLRHVQSLRLASVPLRPSPIPGAGAPWRSEPVRRKLIPEMPVMSGPIRQ